MTQGLIREIIMGVKVIRGNQNKAGRLNTVMCRVRVIHT